MELRHKELTQTVIGIFFDVYNELGYGLLESVYEKALVVALRNAGLACEAQVPITVYFRGENVGDFRVDILVESVLLLELKTAEGISDPHLAQTINYLRATRMELGLILNFGPAPSFKRVINDL